ncbi:hypothetical protein [Alkalimonas sp.]|uniref:hypothetical protein n=1 Tax=Alkalimonas sp. TaxID=1872453 RepID=UPI00263AF76F|nr:hypothetical protein [Alkalimonas sp.]MCC5825750.1 hypothetical protein [Alkalimonas sp.]
MATVESTNPAAFEASQLLGNARPERSVVAEQPANQTALQANNGDNTASDVSSVDISQEARAAFEQDNADFQQALQDLRSQNAQQPAQLVANLFDGAAGSGNQSLTDALAQLNNLAERLNDNRQAALADTVDLQQNAETTPAEESEPAVETTVTATETEATNTDTETQEFSQRNALEETGLTQS